MTEYYIYTVCAIDRATVVFSCAPFPRLPEGHPFPPRFLTRTRGFALDSPPPSVLSVPGVTFLIASQEPPLPPLTSQTSPPGSALLPSALSLPPMRTTFSALLDWLLELYTIKLRLRDLRNPHSTSTGNSAEWHSTMLEVFLYVF